MPRKGLLEYREIELPDYKGPAMLIHKSSLEEHIRKIVHEMPIGRPFHVGGVHMVCVARPDDPRAPMEQAIVRDALAPEDILGGSCTDSPHELDGEAWTFDHDEGAKERIRSQHSHPVNADIAVRHIEALAENWPKNRRLLRKRDSRDGTVGRGARAMQPVFIVGNGPSLAKNAPHLNEIDPDRAVVIYTNRIPAGAETEGRYYSSVDWRGTENDGTPFMAAREDDCSQMTAIFDTYTAHHLARMPWKKRLWVRSSSPHGRRQAQMKREFPWIAAVGKGLVSAYTLLWIAIVWEAPAVVFVGQDMSLSRTKEMHPGERVDWDLDDHTDIYGEPVYTTYNLYRACRLITGQIELQQFMRRQFGRHCARFINATEGGIVKFGCEIMTLQQAIAALGVGR